MSRAIELLLADQVTTKQDFKVDWKEDAKLDFNLQEDLPAQTVVITNNSEVNAAAIEDGNLMFFGTGNVSTNYFIKNNEDQGIEVAIKLNSAEDASYATAVLNTGVYEYEVPLEAHSTDSSLLNWEISYSIATGLADSGSSLADFTIDMLIDFTAVEASDTQSVKLTYGGNGKWSSSDGSIVIVADSAADVKLIDRRLLEQNSLNLGKLSNVLGIFDGENQQPGQYSITFNVKVGGKLALQSSVEVYVDESFVWAV